MKKIYSGIRRAGKTFVQVVLFFPFLGALVYIGQFVGISSGISALIASLGWVVILRLSSLQRAALIVLATTLVSTSGYFAHQPSHDRNWKPEVARLSSFQLQGPILLAKNIRDFQWSSKTDFEERWNETAYDLRSLERVDAIVVPFGDSELAAHVMLSFGFQDGRHLAVSVESRPEAGESYSLIGGAARQLELIYLFGTERDLLGLRILHRGDRVYSFPLRANANFAQELLRELCESANLLQKEPKFYATLRHNCTTTLLRHVNRLREEPIGISQEILFPAKLGQLLHRLGYLDTDLDWPDAKRRFRVDKKIHEATDLSQFSKALRGENEKADNKSPVQSGEKHPSRNAAPHLSTPNFSLSRNVLLPVRNKAHHLQINDK